VLNKDDKLLRAMLSKEGTHLSARAVLLGERLDLRHFSWGKKIASVPLAIALPEKGVAILFRYGAVVFFSATESDQEACVDYCRSYLWAPLSNPESETQEIKIDPALSERVVDNQIVIPFLSIGHLQVIADVMAKSVALALYESQMSKTFEAVEPIATGLSNSASPGDHVNQLLKHIGSTLLSESNMIARVQVSEKPDFLWDEPSLDRFYMRLVDDFELKERQSAIERKLDLVSRTAQTTLDILQARRTLRVEWYIVILIVIEIILDLAKLF
jgi:required for meiotic nuclear division protein 1